MAAVVVVLPSLSFNPRSRTGSDQLPQVYRWQYHRFNPRSRTGSDVFARAIFRWFFRFQSTLPHGERLVITRMGLITSQFQSTLPHGERHIGVTTTQQMMREVSIHAPARGATSRDLARTYHRRFQSTLPHGERQTPGYQPPHRPGFNPRSRTGSDDGLFISCLFFIVSIHAPARGATWNRPLRAPAILVSIHAPARGATPHWYRHRLLDSVSIHAPARGATWSHRGGRSTPLCVSIHAPARGATGLSVVEILTPTWFQSTLPHGERHIDTAH